MPLSRPMTKRVRSVKAPERDAAGRETARARDAIGSFRIDALLGVGGMGEVYRATDTKLGRAVAHQGPARLGGPRSGSARPLEREARVLAALNHPHIAAIYGIEDADGVRALVLELVEGADAGGRSSEWSRRAMAVEEALPSRDKSPKHSKLRTRRGLSTAI